jgi:tRNA nucleotidyltransferase (CCA-adding enzyme)
MPEETNQDLAGELRRAYPELDAIAASGDSDLHVVGGAVRDLLLGRGRSDNIDIIVAGEPATIVQSLEAEALEHDRFATAKVDLEGLEVDIAAARTERYPHPGALPEVATGATIGADLERRDFSLNAIAVDLAEGTILDPFGGREDLARGVLRVLHPRSFEDDPTRALRAARYAARFGFKLEEETERLLREADLGAVSTDRLDAELERIAAEPEAVKGFELLACWGLIPLRAGGSELAGKVDELLRGDPWASFVPRDRALLRAAIGPAGGEEHLASSAPAGPAEGVELASGRDPIELALARALGAEWLDSYLADWANVRLEIGGEDLIAAGVPEGPAVGVGLAAALRRKLDGELDGAEQELEAALEAARSQR